MQMASIIANGITIEYEKSGQPENPVIMLIRGLGTQLIDWPGEFINGLVDHGFRVVCHDNRDVGLSAKFDELGVPDIAVALAKMSRDEPLMPPYTIDDMALDVIGLQDALGISAAHIVGMSMGGFIAQKLAANHAKRVISIVSMMSGSGNPNLPPAKPEAMAALTGGPENPDDRESIISFVAESLRIIGSPGYPESEAYRRKIATARYERCHHPAGKARQMMAVLAEGSHVDLLKTIDVPTLVIHGADDPLVPVEAGKDTAANIPNARIEIIEGMGHNIPIPLVPKLVDLIADHAKNNS
jgi:pimeloyl-ACP methyl ester carboxylesterase